MLFCILCFDSPLVDADVCLLIWSDPLGWSASKPSDFPNKRMSFSYDVGIWRFSPKNKHS